MSKLHILITGATGRIGRYFTDYLGDRYKLRLGARNLEKLGDSGIHEVAELNLENPEQCSDACEGIDVVVHLAANPSPAAPFYGGVLEANIIGTYNIYEAAIKAECKRVVFASSIRTVEGHPLDLQVHHDSPVGPDSLYGASKCFGEALAFYFAYQHGLSSVVVRIGRWGENSNRKQPMQARTARNLSAFVSRRDLSQLMERAMTTPDIKFAIVNGISDNRFKRMDIESARKLLGYEPQDDAFAQYVSGMAEQERWYQEAPGRRRTSSNER